MSLQGSFDQLVIFVCFGLMWPIKEMSLMSHWYVFLSVNVSQMVDELGENKDFIINPHCV